MMIIEFPEMKSIFGEIGNIIVFQGREEDWKLLNSIILLKHEQF